MAALRSYGVTLITAIVFVGATFFLGPRVKELLVSNRQVESQHRSGAFVLSSSGRELLQKILLSGNLPELHHPSFENLKGEVQEFYQATDYALPWLPGRKPSENARAMIQVLQRAEEKGLTAEDYDGRQWSEWLEWITRDAEISEPDLIYFDVALTVSAMRYISDLNTGRVSPRLFHFELDAGDGRKDPSDFLLALLATRGGIGEKLQELEPPFPAYKRTLAALDRYRALARNDDREASPSSKSEIAPGDRYIGAKRLFQRLQLVGDLDAGGAAPKSPIYDHSLAEGVRRFQRRHGLEATGVLDARTLRALNTPLSQRVKQLELTLERRRWAPHAFERPPIVVNVPEFRLHLITEKYHWALSMNVVVGKAYEHQTPVFSSYIRSIIFRPYWNVPLRIQRQEIIPKLKEDPAYLAANSYEIIDGAGNVVEADPASLEVIEKLESGELGIRQRPGPDNSLGLIKFDSPNRFDIYLHGTPAMELFAKSRRDFSHGCIRVERPFELACRLLSGLPEWTPEKIQEAMNGEQTLRVALSEPVPLLIVYGTAVVTESGEIHFYRDIYGHDRSLERALGSRFSSLQR